MGVYKRFYEQMCWATIDDAVADKLSARKRIARMLLPSPYARQARINYEDLLMQVKTKVPDETRHETAKRHILQAENKPSQGPFAST